MNLDFSKNIFCVITGASRGIGRKIAEEFARRCSKVSFVLMARSEAGLAETSNLIKKINNNAVVLCHIGDLAGKNPDGFKRVLTSVFDPSKHQIAVIFHNAGQIGQIAPIYQLDNFATWRNYYDLNVVSVAVLNAVFLGVVHKLPDIFVVNITSLVGRKPFKYLAMYGSSKAARDLYFKVVALEEPKIAVLNYSPGMVDTTMANDLIANIQNFADSEITASVQENPVKLTPEQTVLKLVSILETGAFKSGDIIDYYD